MVAAIAFVLRSSDWRAGSYTVAYQSCDDASASLGHWDPGVCAANAAAYVRDASLVGVIGPLNSGCTEVELPVLNEAKDGPVAMASPTNTYAGLTHGAPGTAPGEPGIYEPSGRRSFVSLVTSDDAQAAADATLARDLRVRALFILNDGQAYGVGISEGVRIAAGKLGIDVVQDERWDPAAASYGPLATAIRASGAQAVFLGGLIGEGGGRLIAAIHAADPSAQIIAPDGFAPVSADVAAAGASANGMYVSVSGVPLSELPAAGRSFVASFGASLAGRPVELTSVYAAQAAEVVLAAIAASNGTRSGVSSALLSVRLPDGLVGPVAFDADGEPADDPVAIYRILDGRQTTATVIVPKATLLAAEDAGGA